MTKQEFFNLCSNYDYYYGYSDDHSVWQAGRTQSRAISRNKANHPEIHTAFVAFWNNESPNRPKLEDF